MVTGTSFVLTFSDPLHPIFSDPLHLTLTKIRTLFLAPLSAIRRTIRSFLPLKSFIYPIYHSLSRGLFFFLFGKG